MSPKTLKTWKKIRQVLLYMALFTMLKVFIDVHHFSEITHIILILFFFVPELLSEYKPEFMAYIFVRRRWLVYGVLLVSTITAMTFYSNFPFPQGYFDQPFRAFKNITSFFLQGAILGLVTRMMLIHLIYQLIRLRDVFFSKILILVVYTVFLVLVPLESMHLIAFFLFGFGAGFVIHYLSRYSEKRDATYSRLRQNLLTMIEDIRQGIPYRLSSTEEKAVNYFACEKWGHLKRLLNNSVETDVLFFIRLSMHRKHHEYDTALNLIEEKKITNPEFYQQHKNFILLHRALNQNEKTDNLNNPGIMEKIVQDYLCAISLDETCLLSHASLALKLANLIDLNATDAKSIAGNETRKKEALKHIWRAMNIYENRERDPVLLSLITGFTIPFTYAFLLDTYAYVLMKNGNLRFSKALIIQCLYQDPSFSPSYLHLAEWYKEYHKNRHPENHEWKKAARLNLYIAIYNEQLDDKKGNISFISKKAQMILQTL